MKLSPHLLFSLLAASFLLGCSKSNNIASVALFTQPAFTYSKQSGAPPVNITFTNQSKYALSYIWNFGDSSSSTETNPTHTFLTWGVYNVVLTAKGNINTDSCTLQISILPSTCYIQSVIIDSTPEISTPISFFVTLANLRDTPYQTSFYNIPFSNTPVYPSGVWNNLNYQVPLENIATIEIYYELPGGAPDPRVMFYFSPADYEISTEPIHPPYYPQTVDFYQLPISEPGNTHITLGLQWE